WNISTILYPIPEEWIMKDFFLRCRRSPRTTLEASFRSIPVAATPHQSVMARPSSLASTDSPGSHIRNYISTLVRRARAYVPRFAPSFLCRAWRKLQGLTRSTTLIHRHWGERRV
ncbi:hypothetical protein RYX36_007397, partial [Vicia faba]